MRKLYSEVTYVHILDTNLVVFDLWNGRDWEWSHAYNPLPSNISNEILQINVMSSPEGEDLIVWKGHASRVYTVG